MFVCELSHANVNEGVWWLDSSPLQSNDMNQMTCQGRTHRLVLTMTTPDETGVVAFVIGEERTSASLLVVPKLKGGKACIYQALLERFVNLKRCFGFQFYLRRSLKMLESRKEKLLLCPAQPLTSPPRLPGGTTISHSEMATNLRYERKEKSIYCSSMPWSPGMLEFTLVIQAMHRPVPSLL